jgi:uncharacterized protein (DUF1501 family)
MNRRQFIKASGCTGMGMLTMFNSAVNLKAIGAAALDNPGLTDDYKALVCILLQGGNDSYNTLVPLEPEAYKDYAASRSNMALDAKMLIPLDVASTGGVPYGLHPAMPEVEDLFFSGECAFINNVGTLVAPLTKERYFNGSTRDVPLGLFSHSDQERQWMTGIPDERTQIGWGGRVADLLKDMNTNQKISISLSLNGTNIFQQGKKTVPFALDPYNGADLIGSYNRGKNEYNPIGQAIDSLMHHNYQDAFQKTFIDEIRNAQESGEVFLDAYYRREDFSIAKFDRDRVAEQLKMVANTIAARKFLGVKRQIFFVHMGGFDHHDYLLNYHTRDLRRLSKAIGAFHGAMKELKLEKQVTLFTISDFARTLTSNGDGTDHAWGGTAMVVGGSLNGNKFYGKYPSLKLGSALDVGNGVFIPTTSTDEYFAELALWFGVSRNELPTIFPGLKNFYSLSSPNLPLGFMKI